MSRGFAQAAETEEREQYVQRMMDAQQGPRPALKSVAVPSEYAEYPVPPPSVYPEYHNDDY